MLDFCALTPNGREGVGGAGSFALKGLHDEFSPVRATMEVIVSEKKSGCVGTVAVFEREPLKVF